jgi:hypothetical protein
MSALLIVFLVISLLVTIVLAYLLGFKMGGDSWASESRRVRSRAERASRDMHDLTRAAFMAMAEEAQRRTPDRPGSW